MTFNPQEREKRYETLCREIERLIERHKVMPTDELKSRVSAQITMHVRELDEMEKAHREESTYTEEYEARNSSFALHGSYPAIGAGILCALFGVIFGVSIMTLGGMLVLIVSVSSLTRGRSAKAAPSESHSWEWKP